MRWFAILAALLAAVVSVQASDELYVIAHGGTALTPAEVFDVFLGGKQFSGPVKLVPVDNAAAREEFLARVLKMSANKYAAHWTKKSFRDGLNPPPVKGSDAEVIDFVRRTPGAAGYVRTQPSGVAVIKRY